MHLQKRALRKELRTLLAQLPLAVITSESSQVTKLLLELPAYRAATTVAIYASTSTEIRTDDIIQDIFRSKRQCYIPRWTQDRMDMVRIACWDDFQRLPTNRWNIREPSHTLSVLEDVSYMDLIIMPGLAFDFARNRLGHGKGYYDAFLSRLRVACSARQITCPPSVALALQAQVLPSGREIPVDDRDIRPDLILTSNGIIT